MNKLLELKKISLIYQTLTDEVLAIKDLTFSCNKGEFVSIIGPSGCGKTTTLSTIPGILEPTDGEILLEGHKLKSKNNELGYMLQKDHLFSWRTIEKNVYLPLEIKGINTLENRNRCLDLLKKYGLKDFIKSYPDRLSGGMRQRVAIIRTLASNPNLLLLDEPFSALDYQTRLNVCDDVYSIIQKEKKTTLLVTHDISEAISMSDRVIVLTKRPAKVLSIHNFNYDKNIPPLKRRELPTFGKNFELLWRELNYDGK
jgi:NitT/TauT family transport system ATP-binding protein